MPAAPPTATVIVPCFDAEATVERCALSLLAQTGAPPHEIVFVENGSSDRTPAILEELARRHPGRLRVVGEPRAGAYAARNRGLREARGRWVLFTDADCSVAPDWIATLVGALEEGDGVAGGEVVADPDQKRLLARYARAAGILSQRHTLADPHAPFLQTANLGVGREEALAVGGFDDRLFSGGDADFCWRLKAAEAGVRLRFVPEATVRHHHRETVRGLFRQFRRYGESDFALARKHGVRPLIAAARLALDALRLALALPLAVILVPVGAVLRDPLPIALPLLRAVRVIARRTGQVTALLRPGRLHRC